MNEARLQLLDKSAEHFRRLRDEAHNQLIDKIAEVQLSCTHTGAIYTKRGVLKLRMCANCGMTESGYEGGYNTLRVPSDDGASEIGPPQITQASFYRTRQGLCLMPGHKAQLASGQSTIGALIEDWRQCARKML